MTFSILRPALAVVLAFCAVFCVGSTNASDADDTLLDTPDLSLLESGFIHAMAYLPDGSLVIGGGFSRVQGREIRNLARILPDGAVDTSWTPNPNNIVTALAVDAVGNIYIGGYFYRVGGVERPGFARFKAAAHGSVDPNWPASNPEMYSPRRIVVSKDGSAIYAGNSSAYSFKRISADGVVDPSWRPTISGGMLRDMVLDEAGWLHVGGKDLYDPGSGERRPLWRIDTRRGGEVDFGWNPLPFGHINGLALDPASDSLFIGGMDFTRGAATGREHLARIPLTSGSAVDPGWTSGVDQPVGSLRIVDGALRVVTHATVAEGGSVDRGEVLSLDPHSGTMDTASRKLIDGGVAETAGGMGHPLALGGTFKRIGDTPSFNVFREPEDAAGSPRSIEVGHPGWVSDMVRLADGSLILGGYFDWAAGAPASHLLKLRPDLTVDPVWNPAPDNSVRLIEADDEGSIYVTGYFRNIGGRAEIRLAKLQAFGEGLADPNWDPGLIRQPDGHINALLFDGEDHLFVSGYFDRLPDAGDRRIVKVALSGKGEGRIVPEWKPALRSGGNAMALDSRRQLYAHVGFGVERMASTGTGDVDAAWKIVMPEAADGYIGDIAIDRQDRLYVGGRFEAIQGQRRANVARVLTGERAEVDPTWRAGVEGHVSAIALDHEGRLYLAGGMTSVSGVPASGLVRFQDDVGSVDAGWMAKVGVSPDWEGASNLIVDSAARVFVGGTFYSAEGIQRHGFAVFGDGIFRDGVEPADPAN